LIFQDIVTILSVTAVTPEHGYNFKFF